MRHTSRKAKNQFEFDILHSCSNPLYATINDCTTLKNAAYFGNQCISDSHTYIIQDFRHLIYCLSIHIYQVRRK